MAAGFREGFLEADRFRIRYMEAGAGGARSAGASRPMKSGPFRSALQSLGDQLLNLLDARGPSASSIVVGGSGKVQCLPLAG
jgi:hypothetical protein